ncbi:MAG: T9SS type A sorting domain-containing protein [Bacteroidales bacterium]|nr:T9SS type A sorting domain-containing protein [Bacteroidales bacterium]MBD5377281.1 T9SS type A sorting domain-containing protein [Bacteroides sp.]
MKKFTLIAAMAAAAISANAAAYNVEEPGTVAFLNGRGGFLDYVILDADMETLLAADKNYALQYVGPNDDTRNLYIWAAGETLEAGDPVIGVDEGTGALSMNQTNAGWAGAGYSIGDTDPANFSHFTDETIFHCAYLSTTANIQSMYLTILNVNGVSLGASNEGKPVVGAAPSEDWQAFAITLGELKKEVAGFDEGNLKAWTGNVLAFGGSPATGWPAGGNFCLDAVYFFTPGEVNDGIEGVNVADSNIVVSNRTISANANGIALYNLNGQLVKSTASSVMGLENLAAGVYVAKAGNSAVKVAVK